MRIMVRKAGRLGLLLFCLLAGYTLLMLAAYSLPDQWVQKNVNAARAVLEEEGNMLGGYATYFWHNGFGITDNLTDIAMYQGLLRGERTVAQAAMRIDYARYWHGYAALLRPLCVFLSIINIRYLNMMVIMGLFLLCFYHCRLRLGAWTGALFGMGLLMSFILIAPFCQQYCDVYILTLAGCYALLRFPRAMETRLPALFTTLGSLVCFFDFLTFPVLALGYPLVICLLLRMRAGESAAGLWKKAIGLSALWMAGYVFTWLGKALVGALLTGQDMFSEVFSQVALRTTGGYEADGQAIEISLKTAVQINLETFFMGPNIAMFAFLLLACTGRALSFRMPAREWARALPIAATALYPFLWYAVMQNHVRLHFWMTYRMLAVTVFAACAYLTAVGSGREKVRSGGHRPLS